MAAQAPTPEELAQLSKQNRSTPLFGVTIFLTVLSTVFAVLRVYAQRLAKRILGPDDICLIIGWLLVVGLNVSACLCYYNGFGKHTAVVLAEPDPLPKLLIALQAGYAVTILWGQSLVWIKLSLLLFYRFVFRVGNKSMNRAIWAVGIYVVAVGIACLFDEIFQCLPVAFFWAGAYELVGQAPPVMGTCPAFVPRSLLFGVLNFVSDILILLLPLFGIRKLQMPRSRKWAIGGVFVLGGLTCVVDIVRIPYLLPSTTSGSSDVLWDDTWPTLFATLEPNAGLICACLPCLKPLWVKTKKLTSSRSRSGATGTNPSNSDAVWSVRRDITVVRDDGSTAALNDSDYVPLKDWEDTRKERQKKDAARTSVRME